MAGLLDGLDSDVTRFGLGLLSASGSNANFGQNLSSAVGSLDQYRKAKAQDDFQKMQMANYLSEIEQRKNATAMQKRNQSTIDNILGDSQARAIPDGAFSLSADGYGPSLPAAMKSTSQGGIGGLSVDQVVGLKRAGLDVMKEFEWANNPQKYEQGSTYENRITGKREYMPSLEKGIAPDGRGGYGVAPGYSAANAQIEGDKASAVEGAKAGFDLVDVPMGNGQIIKMPRNQAVKMLGGNQGNQSGGMQGNGLDLSRVTPAQMLELAKNDPEGFQGGALQRGAQRFQGGALQPKPTASGFGMTQSPDEIDAQKLEQERKVTLTKESAQAGVKRIYDGYDSAKNSVDALTTLNESRKAIAGGVYGGAGADVKLAIAKGLQGFGFNVDPTKVTNTDYLQSTVGEGILAKAKTLGANPTDNDARIIRSIVGSIGTDPNALNKLLDKQEEMFSRTIDNHNKTYQMATKNGFSSPYDMTIERPMFEAQTSKTPEPNGRTSAMSPGGWSATRVK